MKYFYETSILICIMAMVGMVAHRAYLKPRLEVVAQNSGVCTHCGYATVLIIKETRE